MSTAELSPKQHVFVQEFLIDRNAAQAAILAGYSKRNAHKIGSELLGKTRVRAEIHAAISDRSKRTQDSQDQVLEEIARIVFADPRRAFDGKGNLLPVQEWPDELLLRPLLSKQSLDRQASRFSQLSS